MAKSKMNPFTSGGTITGGALVSALPNGGLGSAIGAGMVGAQNDLVFKDIIADGKNLVLRYNTPGSRGATYFCLKNVHLKNFQFNINHGDIPQGNLDFSFFDSESRSFDIPDHIPEEQHNQYIMEQFDLENNSTK